MVCVGTVQPCAVPGLQLRELLPGESVIPQPPPVDDGEALRLPPLTVCGFRRLCLFRSGLCVIEDQDAVLHPVGGKVLLKMREVSRFRRFHSVQQIPLKGVAHHIALFVQQYFHRRHLS